MKSLFLTDRGLVRKHNEDSGGIYLNKSEQVLAIIADGMGGHQSGDVASQMTVSIIGEKWKDCTPFKSPNKAEAWLSETIKEINKTIYERSQLKDELNGMGTTVVVTIITDEFITVGHIGDSRCYIENQNGFKQITEDHSLVNLLMRTGQITIEDAQNHPRKNIVSRALGTSEDVDVDIQSLSIEDNDKVLLCSDGLTDKINNSELKEIFISDNTMDKTAQDLVDLANDRGGEDNISLIILRQTPTHEVGEDLC